MRESMARLTPRFSADRTVREYTEQHYLPAAACQSRVANKGAIGKQMVDWRHSLEQKWATLHFGTVKVRHATGSTFLKFKSVSTVSIPRPCAWNYMPMASKAVHPCGRK
jgi:glucan phosphorylase